MIALLLERALRNVVKTGALRIRLADGGSFVLGDGTGDPVAVRFTDKAAPWELLLDPELRTGELFMDGRLTVEQGSIYEFLHLILRHSAGRLPGGPVDLLDRMRNALLRLGRGNDERRAERNVRHHYDLDDRLYGLFLDPEWQYSCAYFEHGGQSLAEAQTAKMRHIAAKLLLRGGERVLDIGCGWGGLACYLAGVAGAAQVTGITLSHEQINGARQRAAERGLSDRIDFRLEDYRLVAGEFDRIVSVGMFEHVGQRHYQAFFDACAQRLPPDGVMLLHTIGLSDGPSLTNPWITKYIFPGGHLPALSEILPAVERAGLMVCDLEVLRLHYAETLHAWRVAFTARRSEAAELFDVRFCRMWEYYLSMAETAFRCEGLVVFQLQLCRQVDTLPVTRSYMAKAEAALRAREVGHTAA